MKQPQIKSDKQFVRLWYEFYRLCLRERDLRHSLDANLSAYADWGDGSEPFDQWWRTHKDLFELAGVQSVSTGSASPGFLLLKVPVTAPLTRSVSEVRSLIKEAQDKEMVALGLDPLHTKSSAVRLNRVELAGKELRGKNIYDALIVVSHWLDLSRPAINPAFATSLHQMLGKRKRSTWLPHGIEPSYEEGGLMSFDQDQIRKIRRFKDRGWKAAQNVSEGLPPHY
ncbi:hypothetical protein [Brevundimonas sp. DC300-4]|uniref:hypothetical protein n=1 Tax=Brevundimonas sp. DC300-4 TaxID=2804594 RepID=UPI003CFB4AB9